MTKVSVLMPTYNAEKYVSDAIQSVLIQDYENIQLVICDDASTDNTSRIISEYQIKFPEKLTTILNKKNIGVTLNCNMGLEKCEGEFIAFFAGDDIMLPGKISKQVAMMKANSNIVLSYHSVEIFNSESGKMLSISNQHSRENISSYRDILLKCGIPGGCSIMIRKDAIPEGAFDSRLKTVSDWLFIIEVALKGQVAKMDGIYARYRKHNNGLSQQSLALLDESLYALDLLLDKYPEQTEFPNLVRQAKARYLAGEVFRQLQTDKAVAFVLSKRILALKPRDFKYKLVFILALLNYKTIFAGPAIRFLSTKGKLFIKRVI